MDHDQVSRLSFLQREANWKCQLDNEVRMRTQEEGREGGERSDDFVLTDGPRS